MVTSGGGLIARLKTQDRFDAVRDAFNGAKHALLGGLEVWLYPQGRLKAVHRLLLLALRCKYTAHGELQQSVARIHLQPNRE